MPPHSTTARSIHPETLYREAVSVSGPHAQGGRNCDGKLYGSIHWPRFTRVDAQRDTLVRFSEFECPRDFSRKRVLDLGCGIGALSFEAARRGAAEVSGFEFRQDRVDVGNKIARYLGIDDRVRLEALDLAAVCRSQDAHDEFCTRHGEYDVVFCCSLDAYIDPHQLYPLLSQLCRGVCYFESNQPNLPPYAVHQLLNQVGFVEVEPFGRSASDPWPRDSYRLDKRRFATARYLPGCRWNHTLYRYQGRALVEFENLVHWEKLRRLYDRIAHIPYVPALDFSTLGSIGRPWFERCLGRKPPVGNEALELKPQLIDFVRQLNAAGIAHRDLHANNVYLHGGKLYVCDWEFMEENPVPLGECYDLTGRGLHSPCDTQQMHVFHEVACSLANVFSIERSDFGL